MRGEQLFAVFMILMGIIMLVGTYRQWEWLANPPDNLWPVYFPSLIKR